jgi:DUF1009 family protein
VIGAHDIAPGYPDAEGRSAASASAIARHRQGSGATFAATSPFDVGQGVVVADGHVPMIEAVKDGLHARPASWLAAGTGGSPPP